MSAGYPTFFVSRIWFSGTAAAPLINIQYNRDADPGQAATVGNFTVTPALPFTASYNAGTFTTTLAISTPLAPLDHQEYLVSASSSAIQDQATHLHVLGANNYQYINRGGVGTEGVVSSNKEGPSTHAPVSFLSDYQPQGSLNPRGSPTGDEIPDSSHNTQFNWGVN
jgi:hypothetical protein